jgi:hypothetical protein
LFEEQVSIEDIDVIALILFGHAYESHLGILRCSSVVLLTARDHLRGHFRALSEAALPPVVGTGGDAVNWEGAVF